MGETPTLIGRPPKHCFSGPARKVERTPQPWTRPGRKCAVGLRATSDFCWRLCETPAPPSSLPSRTRPRNATTRRPICSVGTGRMSGPPASTPPSLRPKRGETEVASLYVTFQFATDGAGGFADATCTLAAEPANGRDPWLSRDDIEDLKRGLLLDVRKTVPSAKNIILTNWMWLRE